MGTRIITGSRVAVIGGSIAGCAAAIALSRAGCDVTVYERSLGDLADRGFGIGLPLALQLTRLHSGTLKVSSQLGRGTVVTISMPRERCRLACSAAATSSR